MADSERSRWAHSRAPHLDPWREQDACGVGFVARASGERSLYLARRTIERRIAEAGPGASLETCFVCSLSCRTLVYKALLTGTELGAFFPDLQSPDYETALAVFHQRYSTNTSPSWALAQP